jgi:hypothetical protein
VTLGKNGRRRARVKEYKSRIEGTVNRIVAEKKYTTQRREENGDLEGHERTAFSHLNKPNS